MLSVALLATALLSATTGVNAHGYVQSVTIDNQWYAGWNPMEDPWAGDIQRITRKVCHAQLHPERMLIHVLRRCRFPMTALSKTTATTPPSRVVLVVMTPLTPSLVSRESACVRSTIYSLRFVLLRRMGWKLGHLQVGQGMYHFSSRKHQLNTYCRLFQP